MFYVGKCIVEYRVYNSKIINGNRRKLFTRTATVADCIDNQQSVKIPQSIFVKIFSILLSYDGMHVEEFGDLWIKSYCHINVCIVVACWAGWCGVQVLLQS